MTSSEHTPESLPQGSTSPSITRELAVGSGWMVGAQLAIQLIGLLSTIILARLLIPADFGLVAESEPLWQRIETKCVVCDYHFLLD